MKVLRSDNGGEYTSMEFKAYLTGKGIEHQLSIPRRPKKNEVAERMNQTLTNNVLNIGYRDRIGWVFVISDIGYQERYQGYACISGIHIGHYI